MHFRHKMPEIREVTSEEIKRASELKPIGYLRQLYEKIKEAHGRGHGLEVKFCSVSASNKNVGLIAGLAKEDGFDVYSIRVTPKQGTVMISLKESDSVQDNG